MSNTKSFLLEYIQSETRKYFKEDLLSTYQGSRAQQLNTPEMSATMENTDEYLVLKFARTEFLRRARETKLSPPFKIVPAGITGRLAKKTKKVFVGKNTEERQNNATKAKKLKKDIIKLLGIALNPGYPSVEEGSKRVKKIYGNIFGSGKSSLRDEIEKLIDSDSTTVFSDIISSERYEDFVDNMPNSSKYLFDITNDAFIMNVANQVLTPRRMKRRAALIRKNREKVDKKQTVSGKLDPASAQASQLPMGLSSDDPTSPQIMSMPGDGEPPSPQAKPTETPKPQDAKKVAKKLKPYQRAGIITKRMNVKSIADIQKELKEYFTEKSKTWGTLQEEKGEEPDGKWGEETYKAVRRFQQDLKNVATRKLKEKGRDPKTVKVLPGGKPITAFKVDGIWGPDTDKLAEFAKSKNFWTPGKMVRTSTAPAQTTAGPQLPPPPEVEIDVPEYKFKTDNLNQIIQIKTEIIKTKAGEGTFAKVSFIDKKANRVLGGGSAQNKKFKSGFSDALKQAFEIAKTKKQELKDINIDDIQNLGNTPTKAKIEESKTYAYLEKLISEELNEILG